jgi:hypothetical protein
LDLGSLTTKRGKALLDTSALSVPDFVNKAPLVEAIIPFMSHRQSAHGTATSYLLGLDALSEVSNFY